MGKWLRENGRADVAAQERYRAMLVLENLAAIETWRDGLDEARRRPVLLSPSIRWARCLWLLSAS
jgi:hypothetical protein